METPSSTRRQALRQGADSNKVQVRKEIALSKYYSIARRLLDSFTAAFDDRSLDEAYIYGVRFASLCVESIPQHPSYKHRSYAIQQKEMSDKCKHVLECLEIVRQRMDAEEILREQQRQRAEEAELEARRRQEKEDSDRQEATKTQMSALAKLSAMQRGLNQPATKKDVSKTEKKESLPTKENQPKKTGLIRAQVNFGAAADDSSSVKDPVEEPAHETTKDTAKASSFMGSAMSRMTSMVSRAPKKKETSSEKPSEGTKQLVPAQIMDSPLPTSKSQPDKLVNNEAKKQQPNVEKSKELHSVPDKKKEETSKEKVSKTQPDKAVKSEAKKQKPNEEKSNKTQAVPKKTKATSEKKKIESSQKNVPIVQADKPAVKPKPSKLVSTAKTETTNLQVQQTVKPKDKPIVQASAAPRKDKVVQPVQPKADVAPPAEASAMEVDKVQEDAPLENKVEVHTKEPEVQQHHRRPEEDTIHLLEASIAAQLKRIEEIEQTLIPKLLEQARKEHKIAKTTCAAKKQERMLHKRKAIHSLQQKRKWEKLAETTKIGVFHMETQIFRLENALEDQQVQEAIVEAKSTIKSMGNSVGVSDLQGFSDAVGAGELVKVGGGVDGEEDEIMMEELESWIGSSSSAAGSTTNQAEETLNADDLSILSLPSIPQQQDLVVSPSSIRSKDKKIAKKKLLVPAAM